MNFAILAIWLLIAAVHLVDAQGGDYCLGDSCADLKDICVPDEATRTNNTHTFYDEYVDSHRWACWVYLGTICNKYDNLPDTYTGEAPSGCLIEIFVLADDLLEEIGGDIVAYCSAKL